MVIRNNNIIHDISLGHTQRVLSHRHIRIANKKKVLPKSKHILTTEKHSRADVAVQPKRSY